MAQERVNASKILLNGALVEHVAAQVHVEERGFRFGDGVFETVPVHRGVPYLWEYHRERLEAGLAALHIPYDCAPLKSQAIGLLEANGLTECGLRIYISRGIGSHGYLPLPSAPPTLVMQTRHMPAPPPEPVSLWQSRYEKISPRALPTHCKLAQGLNATLAQMEAAGQGCFDALQLTAEGSISEAGSANIFWLKEGKLFTPSLACGALAGITRRRVIALSPYPVEEGAYTLADLAAAEAVVLTSALLGIVPVRALLPQECRWESAGLAKWLNGLRNQDIRGYAARMTGGQ